jgi:hypothetical protein
MSLLTYLSLIGPRGLFRDKPFARSGRRSKRRLFRIERQAEQERDRL